MTAEIHRTGSALCRSMREEFSCPVKVVSDSDKMGTIITFLPDKEIFTMGTEFNYEILAARLRNLHILIRGSNF